jgi:hypothetical protein
MIIEYSWSRPNRIISRRVDVHQDIGKLGLQEELITSAYFVASTLFARIVESTVAGKISGQNVFNFSYFVIHFVVQRNLRCLGMESVAEYETTLTLFGALEYQTDPLDPVPARNPL